MDVSLDDLSLDIPIDDPGRPLRLLQISDCHIGPTEEEQLLGLNTNESLMDVIEHISAAKQTWDLLLTTGDISNNGGAKTYRRFLSVIESCPIAYRAFGWLPGNHDAPDDMSEVQGRDHLVKQINMGNWVIVLLNTQVPGHTHGNLVEAELNLLDDILGTTKDKHVLIFMHHQPVPVGCQWLDNQKVRSEYAFFKIIDQYTHIRAVIWGHVHQVFNSERNGVPLMSTPSTCIQFKANSDEFAIDSLMPGYRWFELAADGALTTRVERIPQKHYPIDFNSEGY